jgi:hypothetical protein
LTDEQQAVAKEMKVNIDIPDHYFRLSEGQGDSKEGSR